MKILQINKYYYQKGGAETVFFNTIKLLQENGHTVIPFSLKSDRNKPSDYSSFFVDYPELSESGLLSKIENLPAFIYNREAARQLERLLQKEKPDLAHIHLLFNSLSVSILPVLRNYKIPVVMTVHDYRLICPAYTFTDGNGNICEKCLKRKSYWQCTANKCSKRNIPNSLLLSAEAYFRKYFLSPADYINRFIFVSRFSRDKHIEASAAFGGKSAFLYNFTSVKNNDAVRKSDYILYFGRLSEEKGISTLTDAIEGTRINLKIVGTGPLSDRLKKDNPGVEFTGFKSGDELKKYIQEALFVVVPSEWYENNPMTVIESMTLGTPVIGSRIGGIPELVHDGETGFLFEAKSSAKLKEVLKKALSIPHEDYEQMCLAASHFAKENFSADTHYQKLLQLYNTTIEETGK
ncbi:GDP-mannose-dependent alpha-mannosyltransferase [Bacteroidales bacterium Barb7]|nr:GDP-mannose-dependent alpha-mannosyltransferase [Bacteroidales bacterium Barb7]